MFMVLLAVAIVASVPLLGGDLRRLAEVRLRGLPLVWVALVTQVLITDVLPGHVPSGLLAAVHVGTYALAAGFVALNRSVPGILVLAAGAALNGAVIALNGGELPASASALRAAGMSPDGGAFTNSGVLDHPVLGWLGDTMATPAWLPLRNVLSIGDLVIAAGLAYGVHRVCRGVSPGAGAASRSAARTSP